MAEDDKISGEFKILMATANLFGLEVSKQEAEAMQAEAKTAIAQLESADVARQKAGRKALDEVKNQLLTKAKASKKLAGYDEDTITTNVNSYYEMILDRNEAGLAGARIGNGLMDVRIAALSGSTAKAVENVSLISVPPYQLGSAVTEALAKLDGFVALDGDANGKLDTAELRKAGIKVTDGTIIDVKPFLDAKSKITEAGKKDTDASKKDAPSTAYFKEAIAQISGQLASPETPAAQAAPVTNKR